MRITLNELRRIIREALAEGMEFEQAEKPMKFEQAQEIFSKLIIGAMRDTMRDNPRNDSAMQAAMRAISKPVFEITGWSVEEIQARTEQETRARIADMKLRQGRR